MNKTKIKATFFTEDKNLIDILRSMINDRVAYEAPKNHFHLIYPLEEYGLLEQVVK